MSRFSLFFSLFCLSLTMDALSANAQETRRNFSPVTTSPQLHSVSSPIANKKDTLLSEKQLTTLAAKYRLSDAVVRNNLLVGTVKKGCNLYDIADFYIDYYSKIGDKEINKVSYSAVLTMVIELNSTRTVNSIYNDNRYNLILRSGGKILFTPPSNILNKKIINNIQERINGLKIYGDALKKDEQFINETKVIERYSSEMPYNFRSKHNRIDEFMKINRRSFDATDATNLEFFPNNAGFMIKAGTKLRNLAGLSKYGLSEETVNLAIEENISLSLEYNVEAETKARFVCLDFSILENASCEGDKCLSKEVVKEVKKILDEYEDQLQVFPLINRDVFNFATNDEIKKYKRWCGPSIFHPKDGSYSTFLGKCNNERADGYACSDEKILLKYIGNSSSVETTSLTFLLIYKNSFSKSNNTFVDAINVNLKLHVENVEQGQIVKIYKDDKNSIAYDKFTDIQFPKELNNKHTLVVLKNNPNTTFALITKNIDSELNLVTWEKNSQGIYEYLRMGKDQVFGNIKSFTWYRDALKDAVVDKTVEEKLMLFETEICNGEDRIEVVYPNQKNEDVFPLTVEYFPADKENKQFVGDCYLVTHRSTVQYSPGDRIDSLHLYLHDEPESSAHDPIVGNIVDELKEIGIYNNFEFVCTGKRREKKCSYQLKDNKGDFQPVYWHKTYPNNLEEHKNSLLIFNGHHANGLLSYDMDTHFPFGEKLGNSISPNYLLNVCGSPESFPVNKITPNSKYRNLIYANKPISSKEAAISTFCTIDKYMQINGCITMREWTREVRRCMKGNLGSEHLKELAFHHIGQMEEEICRNFK